MIGREVTRGLVLAAGLAALLAGGCVSTRAEYFERLRRRRLSSFARWEERRPGDRTKPALDGPLNLEEAIRVALAQNTQIQAVLQEKERARGRVVGAYSEALPRVDLSATYTRLDKVQTVDLGVQTFQIGDEDNYAWQVEITQPLYKGGMMLIAQRAARIFSYLSDERVRGTVEATIFAVATAYYDVKLAERLIHVQEAALESAQKHLEDVNSRRRHGTATEYDVLRARVDVSNIRADLIEQRNRRDRGLTRLLRAMGASQRSHVELITDMRYGPVRPDFTESVKDALANRADIYQAELTADLQAEAVKEAYSRYWPRLDAYAWRRWAKPDPHQASRIEWGDQWQAGLRLSWPLFDGFAREGRIIEQEAELRRTEILLADTEEQAVQEVQNVILELQNARELVQSQRLNLQRADRALALVQAGYREGVNTEVELLDARAALTRARGLYYQALHRHTIARIDLRRARGILGPPPGSASEPQQAVAPGQVVDAVSGQTKEPEQADRAGGP
ncbi:MAG: TolC family protein [Planctomycetota bacterium]